MSGFTAAVIDFVLSFVVLCGATQAETQNKDQTARCIW